MGLPIILAIVGLAGTGKSTAVDAVITHYRVPSVYFGGQVLAEVQRRGLPPGPDSERLVREQLRAADGMAAVALLSVDGIREALAADPDFLLVDGVYSWAEVEVLRAQFDNPLVLIAVHAPRALREERLAHRPIRPITAAQLRTRDESEVRALDKATPIALADLHIVNDADEATFEAQLLALVDRALADAS